MAALVIVITATGGTLAIVVALLTIREKLWPKPPLPHPLDDRLRDITIAIRALKAD